MILVHSIVLIIVLIEVSLIFYKLPFLCSTIYFEKNLVKYLHGKL